MMHTLMCNNTSHQVLGGAVMQGGVLLLHDNCEPRQQYICEHQRLR